MRRWCIYGVLAAMTSLPACAPSPLVEAWSEVRPLGERVETDSFFSTAQAPSEEVPLPTAAASGELTLRQSMALGLKYSPDLKSFAWEVRAAEARILQAGRWDNPELDVEFENFGGSGEVSGSKSLETTISLAQSFSLGGDIQYRLELAGHQARLAGWEYEAARLGTLMEITRRYVAVLLAQRQIDIAHNALQLAEQVRESTRKRIEAGDAPAVELARASVPVATARVELKRTERVLSGLRKQLSLTWGQSIPTFERVVGNLDRLRPPPAPETLVELINQNPQVARWASEISSRQAELRLASAQAVPDLTVRLGYRYLANTVDSALVAGISLPLPLFDRNKGNIQSARLNLAAANQRRHQAEILLETALSRAYTRLAGAYDESIALRDEALPPAREAFTLTKHAFDQGDLAFIDVIDAERTLVELRSRYLEALADYHTAVTEVEGLIGQGLDTLGSASELPVRDEGVSQ